MSLRPRKDRWDRKTPNLRLTSPLRNGEKGPYTLSGAGLAGMIRNVLKVATGSHYAPINGKYPGKLGRSKYPITCTDVYAAAGKQLKAEARQQALNEMENGGNWQTIAEVAERSYVAGSDQGDLVLDWANAMMGFVLGEGKNPGQDEDQWRPDWPTNVSTDLPQGMGSRVMFSFADCAEDSPELWPVNSAEAALKITGAGPKVSFYPSYLKTGKWDSPDAKLAGLKVYPVHDPDLEALEAKKNQAVFRELSTEDRGDNPDVAPSNSDTLLQFLKASTGARLSFHGTVYCRNLAPLEFGALVWSLFLGSVPEKFGEAHGDLRHNMGHLRGFGMGQLAPVLLSADLSINPSETSSREELTGTRALTRMKADMQDFLCSDTGRETDSARKRLLLFKSLSYSEHLKSDQQKRLKPYRKPEGTDGKLFSELKGIGDFRFCSEDDEIAEIQTRSD